MDLANLRENHPKLISHLEEAAYAKDYVDTFKREIRYILRVADSDKVKSYADVYRMYEESNCSQNVLRRKRILLGAIERFDLYGQYPDGTRKQPFLPRGAYHLLSAEYKSLIDYYVDAETKCGNKNSSSIRRQANIVATFLLTLQQSGALFLSDVTEKNVFSVFSASDGTPIRRSSRTRVAAFLRVCVPAYPACERVLAYLPAFRSKRKNIQYLTAEEITKIKKLLSNNTPNLTLRDKAIVTIALYTGLRGCDIANMTMDAIDWEKDILSIRQQKTQVPLTLPLSAIVGNAIHEYIEMERPKTECEYIFISQVRPFGRIQGNSTTSRISSTIMKEAGVRQEPSDRQGLHVFRHYLAAKLLGNGIPRPIISNIVGHTSPASLDTYLSTDFTHLKECGIGIERFPVPEEVFAI